MRLVLTVLLLVGVTPLIGQLSGQQSVSGVVVIRGGSSRRPAVAPDKDKKQPADPKAKADAKSKGAAAAQTSQPSTVQPKSTKTSRTPETRRTRKYAYDASGNQVEVVTTGSQQYGESGTQSVLTLRNIEGREVPYLTRQENVVKEGLGESVVERRAHRFDTAGNPTSQQLVREERRTLADGTVETVTTTYESDINGRMQPVDRTTTREKASGNTSRTVTSSERPDINGGFSTYKQEESNETRKGDSSSKVDTVRRVAEGGGRLVESEREQSVMSKSGATLTTETKLWKRSAVNPEKIELHSRKIGKRQEESDGSSKETIQVYGYSSGGGATSINTGGPQLQETITRDTAVRANGETHQTTTTLRRSVADPSQMGEKIVERKVARPTPDGETIQTHVYEQGVNGRMRQTQSSVEQVLKEKPQAAQN